MSTPGFKHQRINKDDAALLIIDHQIGLFELVKDYGPVEFKNSVLAHAALGKVFNLPIVMTTSTDNGGVDALHLCQLYTMTLIECL